MKQTAVEWLREKLRLEFGFVFSDNIMDQAKEIEREQRGYSKEDVIKIVEKSRETGLTAEYLLLTFKSE